MAQRISETMEHKEKLQNELEIDRNESMEEIMKLKEKMLKDEHELREFKRMVDSFEP